MTSTTVPAEVYVGVDAHTETLEVMIRELDQWQTVENTAAGRAALCQQLQALPVVLIVVEASGGVERGLVADCAAAELPLAVVNPTRVRAYAQAQGILAKTDAIDAGNIADFAAGIRPEPQELRSAARQELDALVRRRVQINKMLTAERNRRRTAPPTVQARVQQHIAWLVAEREALEEDMLALVAAQDAWEEQFARDASIPGVGPITTLTLIAQVPELGQLSHKKIGALIGVVPYNNDSGKRNGQRHIYGGRSGVRATLYMAVMACIVNQTPVIYDFYQRLRDKGKPHKVAATACMRKLLTILNAMERDKQPWRPPEAVTTSA